MRNELLTGLFLAAVAAVAGLAAYGVAGASLAVPGGLRTVIAVGWALLPLTAAWGLLGALLWWLYGWLAGKW